MLVKPKRSSPVESRVTFEDVHVDVLLHQTVEEDG